MDKKIKILILGSNGMLGSACGLYFAGCNQFKVHSLARESHNDLNNNNIIIKDIVHDIIPIIGNGEYDYLINCIGKTNKVLTTEEQYCEVTKINSYLPHFINKLILGSNTKLIHISTDCVFSGRLGNYDETSEPDPTDFYGMSKLVGEVQSSNSITVRTSIIGPEFKKTYRGLFEWFMKEKNPITGFDKAFFSGLTTWELAQNLNTLIQSDWETLPRLIHIPGPRINKYELLCLINEVYGCNKEIFRDSALQIDRSLCSDYYCNETKSWEKMLTEQFLNVRF